MSTSYVRLNVKDKVGYIELYNPPHNGLPASMLASLTNLITKAGSDPTIAVVVLKSGGEWSLFGTRVSTFAKHDFVKGR